MDTIQQGRYFATAAGPVPPQCTRVGSIWACARRTGDDSAEVVIAAPSVERGVYLYATAHAPPRWIDRCAAVANAVLADMPDAEVIPIGRFGWPVAAMGAEELVPEVGWVDDLLSVVGGVAGGYLGGPAGAVGGATAGRLAGAGIESAMSSPAAGLMLRYRYAPSIRTGEALRYANMDNATKREVWPLATMIARNDIMRERGLSDFGPIGGEPREIQAWRDRLPTDADISRRRSEILRTFALFRDTVDPNRVGNDAAAGANALLALAGAVLAGASGNYGGAVSQGASAIGSLAQRQGATGAAGGLAQLSALARPAAGATPAAGAATSPLAALQALLGTGATGGQTTEALAAAARALGAGGATPAAGATGNQVNALLAALGAAR